MGGRGAPASRFNQVTWRNGYAFPKTPQIEAYWNARIDSYMASRFGHGTIMETLNIGILCWMVGAAVLGTPMPDDIEGYFDDRIESYLDENPTDDNVQRFYYNYYGHWYGKP